MSTETVKFYVKKNPNNPAGHWYGRIQLPVGAPGSRPHAVEVTAKGVTKGDAIRKAAGLAEQIASNPIVQAAMPPGTAAAVKALKYLDSAGASKAMKKIAGKGAKRIAKALKFW